MAKLNAELRILEGENENKLYIRVPNHYPRMGIELTIVAVKLLIDELYFSFTNHFFQNVLIKLGHTTSKEKNLHYIHAPQS